MLRCIDSSSSSIREFGGVSGSGATGAAEEGVDVALTAAASKCNRNSCISALILLPAFTYKPS